MSYILVLLHLIFFYLKYYKFSFKYYFLRNINPCYKVADLAHFLLQKNKCDTFDFTALSIFSKSLDSLQADRDLSGIF